MKDFTLDIFGIDFILEEKLFGFFILTIQLWDKEVVRSLFSFHVWHKHIYIDLFFIHLFGGLGK